MFTALKNQRRPGLALAALCICCLPVPAFSDELQYLPDNAGVIASVDVMAALKSKTYQEILKAVRVGHPNYFPATPTVEIEKKFAEAKKNIGRVTVAFTNPEEPVIVVTANKQITIADVKAMFVTLFIDEPGLKPADLPFKEVKHGGVTIYQFPSKNEPIPNVKEGEKVKPAGKPNEAPGFYLAEGKYVVGGTLPDLKKIIDRNKAAKLAIMAEGLKAAGLGNTVSFVVDLELMRTGKTQSLGDIVEIFRATSVHADMKANIDKVQVLALKANETDGKLNLSATLICKDATSAAALKTVGEKLIAEVKVKMTAIKKSELDKKDVPAHINKDFESAFLAVSAMKWSSAGNQVTVTVEIAPERAVSTFSGVMLVGTAIAWEALNKK